MDYNDKQPGESWLDYGARKSGSLFEPLPRPDVAAAPPWEVATEPLRPEPANGFYKPVVSGNGHKPAPSADSLYRSYATVAGEETYSIWEGKLPLKEVVLGAGAGGIGKGFWLADIAARVTNGDEMPDGTYGDLGGPMNVITVTPEDHVSRTMKWRLEAAGADPGRVFDMTRVLGHDFTIPDDIPLLERAIDEIGNVGLVVLDPLGQMCDKSLTSAKFVRRSVWAPLRRVAEDKGCTIFGMHHVVKSGSVAGSVTLEQSARLLLRFSLSDMDPSIRILSVGKTNISAKGTELTYTLTGEGHDVRVEYVEPDIMPAENLDGGDNKKHALLAVTRATEPVTPKSLAAEIGCTPGNARVLLHRLSTEGLIEKASRGKYVSASSPSVTTAENGRSTA